MGGGQNLPPEVSHSRQADVASAQNNLLEDVDLWSESGCGEQNLLSEVNHSRQTEVAPPSKNTKPTTKSLHQFRKRGIGEQQRKKEESLEDIRQLQRDRYRQFRDDPQA